MHGMNKFFHDIDFIERRHDHQLQIQLLEQLHRKERVFRVNFAERLIHDDEPERSRLLPFLIDAELIRNR